MRACAVQRGWLFAALAFMLSLIPLAKCGSGNAGAKGATGPIRVVVSIAPLKGLVEELTKDLGPNATVDLLVPVGAVEHGYEIPPSMISKLAQADVVVYVGLGLEPQIEKFLKEHPAQGRHEVCFAEAAGAHAEEQHDHAHDDDHGHNHSGIDPHLWLDASLVAKLVPAIGKALADAARGRAPDDAISKLDASAARLAARVAEIDAQYEELLRPFRGATLITAHAAWGRLTDRYGLEQAPLAGLEASEPSPAAIARAVELIREKMAGAIFSEPQINATAVNNVAERTGAAVHRLDPLGDGDWFKMMTRNLDELVAGLSRK